MSVVLHFCLFNMRTSFYSASVSFPELAVSHLRLTFRSAQKASPGRYLGSAWRGVFGHALKNLVCVTRCERCADCLLYASCVYTYIFETAPPSDSAKLRNYETVPHPFILGVPWPGESTDSTPGVNLDLTLFGRGNRYAAYMIVALREAGERGIRGLGTLNLESVSQEDLTTPGTWQSIYNDTRLSPLSPATPIAPPAPGRARIHLLTPLRLRHQEEYVGAEGFTFADMFGSLLRRISSLTYFHTDRPLETDFAGLKAVSSGVIAEEKDLRWSDWTRFSSRQQEQMQMGGLTGSFAFNISGREELWPFLWLGQWTHTGKGTSMGLGRYVLEPV